MDIGGIMDIKTVVDIAVQAGKRILEIYQSKDFEIETKGDDSPLTLADRESHRIIEHRLEEAFPGLPVLSEEGKDIPFSERRGWEKFWLVDPLDGTKEFIGRNGEFTVNIALIQADKPVIGVIHVPVTGTSYFTDGEGGAYKAVQGREPVQIGVDREARSGLIAVGSRSHASDEDRKFLSRFDIGKSISRGSSLKFCMIAEGIAHVYYRHGPTWEWDTAAGHAVAEQAGAIVSGLQYNKESLLNGSFLVTAIETDGSWRDAL